MPGKTPEVLYAHGGLALVRYEDGRRELQVSGEMLASMEAAFDAIVAWYWDRTDEELTYISGAGRSGSP